MQWGVSEYMVRFGGRGGERVQMGKMQVVWQILIFFLIKWIAEK